MRRHTALPDKLLNRGVMVDLRQQTARGESRLEQNRDTALQRLARTAEAGCSRQLTVTCVR